MESERSATTASSVSRSGTSVHARHQAGPTTLTQGSAIRGLQWLAVILGAVLQLTAIVAVVVCSYLVTSLGQLGRSSSSQTTTSNNASLHGEK
jgi:hypothetical protein